jgi:hypothetical protein
MALVEVDDARFHAERVQRPDPADAEQCVLPQPHRGIADVEARGDPTVGRAVLRAVRVEEQQRHPAHVDAPDLGDDLAPRDQDGDRQRRAVGAGDERRRDAVGIGVDPVLVLPARAVDPLAEVAVAVHQPDGHERHAAVGGLLEDVAGEHAEAARVHRQRAVDRVLRAEERDGPLRCHAGGHDRLGALRVHGLLECRDPREELRIPREPRQRVRMGLLQEPHRIAETQLPALGVDRREQLRAARRPRPAVVVGDLREHAERRGQPRAQRDRRRAEVGGACVGEDGAIAHRTRVSTRWPHLRPRGRDPHRVA